jgi:hypothetical protein
MTLSSVKSQVRAPVATEFCPWCDQPITSEKLEEIQARIRSEERERVAAEEERLTREKAQVEAKAKADVEAARLDAASALEALRKQSASDLENEKQAATKREAAARAEAKNAAEVALAAKVTAADEARKAAEGKADALLKTHQDDLSKQREVLEKAKSDAVNAERAKALEERLKIESKVEDLKRQLQKKTPDELGEGAELDLYEELKREFPDDKIKRVGKGTAGADIIQNVVHNGIVCGRIVYDSKNHKQWRTEHATKLRNDQIAADADHAVLSSNKFPEGERQLHLCEGVIIANPARVVAVAGILRKHVLQVHELKVSSEERAEKTESLYSYITSSKFTQRLESIDANLDKVRAIDVDELKAHTATWKKRGTLIETLAKAQADLRFEIDMIIGTAVEDD